MRKSGKPVLAVAASLLAACHTAPAAEIRPALLTNPGTEVRLELAGAVQSMSGFARVTLADSDLTRSSELVIERVQRTDGRGDLLQGRELQPPQHFQLQLQDWQCWLLHGPSGKRQRLFHAQCRAATSTP